MASLDESLRGVLKELQASMISIGLGDKADIYSIVRALAYGSKPARTLKANFKNLDKASLENSANSLSLDVGPNPTRAELEAALFHELTENKLPKKMFSHSEGDLIDFVMDIKEEGDFIVPDDYGLLDMAPGLMAYHMISAWIDEEENLVLRLPKEVEQQLEEYMMGVKNMLDSGFETIDEAAVAAVELYGVIPFSDFTALLKKCGISDFPPDVIREGLEQIVAQEGEDNGIYKFDGEYLVHVWLLDEDTADYLQDCKERSKTLPRKVFAKAGFLKFADPAYTDLPSPWAKLRKYIERNLLKVCGPALNFGDLFAELRGIIKLSYRLQEYLELFNEYGIEYDDLDQVNEFVGLLQDVHNNTRLWGNNGFTPLELTLPQNAHETSKTGQSPQGPKGSGTYARNSPCPCGSGKKYKNCCGALPN